MSYLLGWQNCSEWKLPVLFNKVMGDRYRYLGAARGTLEQLDAQAILTLLVSPVQRDLLQIERRSCSPKNSFCLLSRLRIAISLF